MWLEVSIVLFSIVLLFLSAKYRKRVPEIDQTKSFFKSLKFADTVEEVPECVEKTCWITRFMKNDKVVTRFKFLCEPGWRFEMTENVVTFIRFPIP